MKSLILVLGLFIFNHSFSQETVKEVDTKINDVTVFIDGAQVNRSGKTNLSDGSQQVIFKNLPTVINPMSVQVTGKGNFTILSVQYQINYLKEQEITPRIKQLNDSLEILNERLTQESNNLYVYNSEESLILANKNIGGANSGVSMTALKEAADYYRVRLLDIKNKQTALNKKIKEINEKITRINQQLINENSRKNQPTGEISVAVFAQNPGPAQFELSYVVSSAGWIPSYDLRVNEINKPVDLALKGNVFQSSGEDWNNVKLTLSTGNPSIDNTKPVLNPWFLRYYVERNYYKGKRSMAKSEVSKISEEATMNSSISDEMIDLKVADKASSYVAASENPTNFEYTVSIPYTISSNGKEQTIEIQKNELVAQFEYFAIPKRDKDAFLLAKVTGWDKLNLLNGEINLYYDNTYVGKSNLNVALNQDTIDFSLGRDKNIAITRTRSKEFSSKKMIGLNQKVQIGWDINIRNKKSQNVKLTIQDQVPLSTDQDIEIEIIELSKGKHTLDTGIISWEMDLKPAETKTYKLVYSVKYPKDKQLTIE